MIKIEFDFGAGVTGDGAIINPAWAKLAAQDLLAFASAQAGGCSLISREGAWLTIPGDLIVEPGYTLVVLVTGCECVDAIVAFIKTTFQQKSIFVTKTNVNAQLY